MMPMFKRVAAPLLSAMLLSGSIFAGGDVSTTNKVQASLVGNAKEFIRKNPVMSVFFLTLLAAEIRLQTKDPDRLPSRCDLSRLKSSDVNWQDIWNIIDDGLVGQKFKSESIKVKDGKLVVSDLKIPKGILGHFHTYAFPVMEAAACTYIAYLFKCFIEKANKATLESMLEEKTPKILITAISKMLA